MAADLDLGIPTAAFGEQGQGRPATRDQAVSGSARDAWAAPASPPLPTAAREAFAAPRRRAGPGGADLAATPEAALLRRRDGSGWRKQPAVSFHISKQRPEAGLLLAPPNPAPDAPLPLPAPAADPFADAGDDEGPAPADKKASKSKDGSTFAVHVRMQQRNGRKSLTTVQVRVGQGMLRRQACTDAGVQTWPQPPALRAALHASLTFASAASLCRACPRHLTTRRF